MKTQVFAKVIVKRPDGLILVLKRSATDNRRPSEWDLPGGGVEDGESPSEGAVRELQEETGISIDQKQLTLIYAATSFYEPTAESNTRITFYVPVNEEQASMVTVSHEHSELKWQLPAEAAAEHPHLVYKAALEYALDHALLA